MPIEYAELRCRSHFSFLRGASHPAELVESAHSLGYRALALTDQDGVHGIVRALEAAESCGLHLIVGSHLTVGAGPDAAVAKLEVDPALPGGTAAYEEGATLVPLVVLCQSVQGYQNLCQLITLGRTAAPKGESWITMEQVAAHAEGLLALYVGPLTREGIEPWPEIFPGRLYLTASRHMVAGDDDRCAAVEKLGRHFDLPIVAVGDAHTHHPSRQALQDVVTCIRHGTTIADAGDRLFPNAERTLRTRAELGALFHRHPEWLSRTVEVADRCHFSMRSLAYQFPVEMIPKHHTPMSYLRELTDEGLEARYGERVPTAVSQQVEHELMLIEELDFPGYFLTVWDIVRFARSQHILCQGRGSAANSIICYALGITAIDPVRMDLLFERFISAERGEPPDIDVDFEHERREEVIQYVYRKYGRDRAAMVANVICYRGRMALRETGKVLGLGLDQVDRLAKVVGYRGSAAVNDELVAEAGLDPKDPNVQQVIQVAAELEGAPRHLGIHVGGFVITQAPIWHLCPVENATMADRTVVQWDKEDIDILGILKVDLLGLGMLTCVRKSFDLLEEYEGIDMDLDTMPPEDPAVYDALCAGDSLGVFQVESRAQMGMLPRLRPRSFYDIVVEVAIVRPGPIQGDMVHPYLRRRQGKECVEYPHPSVARILGRTYGVPLFQEQVMRLAVVAGGFTPGEADRLRRAMGAWRRRGQMAELADRLIRGLIDNGVDPEYAQRIFEQIHGFGEYGFPESHAASFALIVYASTYLRTHHRAIFLTALINSQPMGFYSPHSIVLDAQQSGIEVRPVDILRSEWDCTLERADKPHPDWQGERPLAIRLGFRLVRGLGEDVADKLMALRALGLELRTIRETFVRADLRLDQVIRLAASGAFRPFGYDRRQAVWHAQGLQDAKLPLFANLFDEPTVEVQRGEGEVLPEMTPEEAMLTEYAATGLSIGYHPVGLVREALRARGMPSAEELKRVPTGRRVTVGGLVIVRQRPETAKGTLFITLEDETGLTNIVVWPKVFEKYRQVTRDVAMLQITGRIQREAGVTHVMAEHIVPLQTGTPPPEQRSRNFR